MNAYLKLALAEGFGEGPVAALLEPDVDPSAWLDQPPSPPLVPPRVARRLRDPGLEAAARAVARQADQLGLQVLTPSSAAYPQSLQHVPLRPLVLFVRGDAAALQRELAVTVVGSRTPTPYGQQATEQLSRALARAGVAIWSGLARGIDGIAHQSCLDESVPTVAVLAGGHDRLYPAEHEALADTIVERGGCVISELPPGRRARRGHFVRRNRILAAATPAVLVIEASLSSGALHTARFAAEGNSDVFALPGNYQSERSHGCHRLIVEGARLIEGPEALLRDLGVGNIGTGQQALAFHCSADEQAILTALQRGPRPSDLLQRECGLERAGFLRALLALQERGSLRRLAGDLWSIQQPDQVRTR